MNWFLDVFSLDCMADNTVANLAAIERLQKEAGIPAICEDDYEATCPLIDLLPDESPHEEPSPLRFTHSQ